MFSGDLRADLISHVDVMIHKYIFFTLFAIFFVNQLIPSDLSEAVLDNGKTINNVIILR